MTDGELIEALNAPEVKSLLSSATDANTRALLERDLRYRRAEIELELSKSTAARNAAIASLESAKASVAAHTDTGSHSTRLTVSLWALGLTAVAALGSLLFDWAFGRSVIANWAAPFGSTWAIGAVWGLIYSAILLGVWEVNFRLRRLPVRRRDAENNSGLSGHLQAVQVNEAARRVELIELVREHVTEILNAREKLSFAADVRVRADAISAKQQRLTLGVGLSEVVNEDNRVATDVQKRLMHLLTSLSGASIGISGPRGAGKSTLLTALCGANPTVNGQPAIAISTSAPVEYDGRDFLLHLFSSLCRQVLRTEGQEAAIVEANVFLEVRRWRRLSLFEALPEFARPLTFGGSALIAVALFLAMLQSLAPLPTGSKAGPEAVPVEAASQTPSTTQGDKLAQASSSRSPATGRTGVPDETVRTSPGTTPERTATPSTEARPDGFAMFRVLGTSPLFTVGVLALVLAWVLRDVRRRGLRRATVGSEPNRRLYAFGERHELVARSLQELSNIAFQRSYTAGWSGGLKMPAGVDMGASSGLTLAQRPESLPELVERFRDFVSEVARAYDNIVLIGIDELDKLKSADQAEAFLNGVKSVFGIPRCFYLISVSEHALAAFERRGIGFRDAFDSALDDVLQLDFLNLEQSRVLLNRRILRLPDPFLQLCHMLSGGLPRDLIRQARSLLECAAERPSGAIGLKMATEQMVARDLAARLRATSIALRTVKEIPETSALLVQVAALPADGTIMRALAALTPFRAHVAGLCALRDSEEGRVLLRLAEELAVYFEVMILLRRIAALLSTSKGWSRASELQLANQLAAVRQALEVGVPVAEVRLAELKKTVNDAAAAIDRLVNPRAPRTNR